MFWANECMSYYVELNNMGIGVKKAWENPSTHKQKICWMETLLMPVMNCNGCHHILKKNKTLDKRGYKHLRGRGKRQKLSIWNVIWCECLDEVYLFIHSVFSWQAAKNNMAACCGKTTHPQVKFYLLYIFMTIGVNVCFKNIVLSVSYRSSFPPLNNKK